MKLETKHDTYEFIFIPILFVLLLINTLYRSEYEQLFFWGDMSTTVTFIGMFVLLLKSWIEKTTYDVSLNKIYLTLFLLMFVYGISYFTYHQLNALHFIRLMLFFLFILGSIRMKWNKDYLKIAGHIFSIASLLFLCHWILSGMPLSGFKSIFRNENYLGVLLFCMLFFNILSIKYSEAIKRLFFIFIMLINLFLILLTGSRAVLIGLMVIIGAWIILKSYHHIFDKLFYLVIIGNLLFVGIYVSIKNTFIGDFLNKLSVSIFNKNLFSGRSDIWDSVLQVIIKNPWFGYGVGIRAPDIAETESTAHNMYLQVLLEVGVVGLLLFVLLLYSMWRVLNNRLNHFVTKWSACFMLGILVYNEFELTLMINNYSIAAFQWLIMTIGISFTENKLSNSSFE